MSKKKNRNLVDKSQLSCGKPVDKITNNVENIDTTSGKIVDNMDENVENSSESCGKSMENKSSNVENMPSLGGKDVSKNQDIVDKPTQSSGKLVENTVDNVESSSEDTRPTAIKITNIHKSFRLPTERAAGLKQAIFNWLKGIKGYTEQKVLEGIDFEIKKGEFVGIVGRNGSGKSTLLKILAQIYYPEQGKVEISGTLVPFIELGVGFNPELTGRENVYLNGALLGFSNSEIDEMYDEIVRFAELEQFMDAKLKNYSSGMQVRLAFSIAIRARGDILILDEVLAVGDAAFQEKCNDYFASLHGNQTVILVTHSMENVRKFCDRAILIEDGKVKTEGDPETVAKAYENLWD